ncbi:hypothetical protein LTR37_019838 [Vermiconidia calcicola]|uniref:Uncharacterized protein n=1 Tax=Vermiconidia calcicola TaxID=1690605 RepID=A0ACC3MCZ9_9PEZI|nr:hypothetical protein LTR37_019838 [Vermiconidia calcicola]
MSGKQSRRMQQFVMGTDGATDGARKIKHEASFEEMKAQPPKNPISARHLPSGGHAVKQPINAAAQPAQRDDRRKPDGRPFYATDTDSIDGTSTATSIQRSNSGHGRHQQPQHTLRTQHVEHLRTSSPGESETGASDEGEESEEELHDDPLSGTLNRKQRKIMTQVDAQMERQASGSAWPTMKGDSYPPTTSGRPSEISVIDATEDRAASEHHKPALGPQAPLPQRGSGQRQQLVREENQVLPQQQPQRKAQQTVRQPVEAAFMARPEVTAHSQQQTNQAFAFGKAPKPQTNMLPPEHGRQQTSGAASTRAAASNNTAQRASAPTADDVSNHPQKQSHATVPKEKVVPVEQHFNGRAHSKARNLAPAQQPVVETAPEYDQLSDGVNENHHQRTGSDYAQEGRSDSELPLDYEAPELFQMDYRALKGQSFDVDPNAAEFKLPSEQQNDSLADKLSTVAVFQAEDQAHFFKYLSLDEWEQSGDWFLGRFSEIVGKLKSARQEKRKAARTFEDEIEQRHTEVGRKRKNIEGSLREMKETGGKVLEGTPKKAKRK